MKMRKQIAFITALTMLTGSQAVLVNAAETEPAEDVTVTAAAEDAGVEDEYVYEDTYTEEGLLECEDDDEIPDSWRQEGGVYDAEKQTVNGKPVTGKIEADGKTYIEVYGSEYLSIDELATVTLSESVAAPGKKTYIDVSFEGDVELMSFINFLDYDRSALKLVSASIDESIPESETTWAPWPDFTATEKGVLFYFRNDMKNIDLSGEHTIRLGFEVKEDAAEGKYEIGLTNTETGGLSGLMRIEYDKEDNFMPVYVPVKYVYGSVTVSRTATPKTNLQPKPLKRVYANIEGVDTVMTGDVNEDGVINTNDVINAEEYFVGMDAKSENADANEDGVVNVADVITLKQYIAE